MTHTAKHTPGPWGVDATGQVCKRATNGSWDLIAYLDESPYYHDKFANARLIAAAPAMYEALKGMLEWARRVKQNNPGPEVMDALNAIARAEGRQ